MRQHQKSWPAPIVRSPALITPGPVIFPGLWTPLPVDSFPN